MRTRNDHRIDPSEIAPEELRRIERLGLALSRPVLVGPSGERVELPQSIGDLLQVVVEAMRRRQAVFVIPADEVLTTQTAARILGMSRPYLTRLLDSGIIPCHFVGTHRRIRLVDLRAFQEERETERRTRLDDLSATIEAAGVYDRT